MSLILQRKYSMYDNCWKRCKNIIQLALRCPLGRAKPNKKRESRDSNWLRLMDKIVSTKPRPRQSLHNPDKLN